MATGDDAVAAGMDLVSPTAGKVKDGAAEINKTRDYIAEFAGGVQPLAKGGTGATTAVAARSALGVPWDSTGSQLKFTSPQFDRIALEAGGVAFPHTLAYLTDIPAAQDISGKRDRTDGDFGSTPIYSAFARANPATSGYISAYINGDGRISGGASSRRFKKEIKAWSPSQQAVLAMQLVTFRYKAAIYDGPGQAPVEVGLIAEDLVDLGLDWLVFYDDEGRPQGIHYERIALALLPVIQDLATTQQDHESRLSKLEGGTA